jgi:hypothetical protein
MNDGSTRTAKSVPSTAPSLRRAVGWTLFGFAAMLAASIAACSDPVSREAAPIVAPADASAG